VTGGTSAAPPSTHVPSSAGGAGTSCTAVQVAAALPSPCATAVSSRTIAVADAGPGRSASAAGGTVSSKDASVAVIGSPVPADGGNAASTRSSTGCGPAGSAQV